MVDGWDFLNQNAWLASALMVVALSGAALTMLWHMFETDSGGYNYLVIVALVVLAISFVLAGVSVGERPIVAGRQLIPMIRVLWLVSAIIFNLFLGMYWGKRVRWRK